LRGLVRPQVTETVLLLGGGLGGVASRLAAVHPARQVIGVVGSDAKRVSAPAECTDIVLAADLIGAIDELTAGRGVDVVIDPVGGQLRRQAFAHLAPTKQVAAAGSAVVQLMDRARSANRPPGCSRCPTSSTPTERLRTVPRHQKPSAPSKAAAEAASAPASRSGGPSGSAIDQQGV